MIGRFVVPAVLVLLLAFLPGAQARRMMSGPGHAMVMPEGSLDDEPRSEFHHLEVVPPTEQDRQTCKAYYEDVRKRGKEALLPPMDDQCERQGLGEDM